MSLVIYIKLRKSERVIKHDILLNSILSGDNNHIVYMNNKDGIVKKCERFISKENCIGDLYLPLYIPVFTGYYPAEWPLLAVSRSSF